MHFSQFSENGCWGHEV